MSLTSITEADRRTDMNTSSALPSNQNKEPLVYRTMIFRIEFANCLSADQKLITAAITSHKRDSQPQVPERTICDVSVGGNIISTFQLLSSPVQWCHQCLFHTDNYRRGL
jgi:hypothetical protein